MGKHSVVDEQIVAGQENLSHDVALVAVVFERLLYAQIVEAVDFRIAFSALPVEGLGTVPLDDVVAVFLKF